MAPKIFITGASGYIGGDTLFALYQKHSDYEIAALIRTKDKADAITKVYPKLRPVLGGNDDFDLIKEEAAKAGVVIHAADASDHEEAAKAIAAGTSEGHAKERPGYWLHTGGTGILTYFDTAANKLGEWTNREFNDWEGVDELTHLPDKAYHRSVDKIVIEAGTKNVDSTKSVVVCPPTIFGTFSMADKAYEMAKFILEKGWVPVIGGGKARRNNVHVHDLSDAFVLLTDAAVSGNTDPKLWGENAYIIIENGEHTWSDIAKKMGEEAHKQGYLKSKPKPNALSYEEANEAAGFQALSWGLKFRAKAEHLNRKLGWKPTSNQLEAETPEIIKLEHERLSRSG